MSQDDMAARAGLDRADQKFAERVTNTMRGGMG
jgi:hypothetical protein